MTIALVHFLTALAMAAAAVPALLRARWVRRCPLTAVLTWHLVILTVPLSLIGALLTLGLTPYETGMPRALLTAASELPAGRAPDGFTAWHATPLLTAAALTAALTAAVVTSALAALRTRRRHRDLLALVARPEPGLPGVLVLDHPGPTAYCVPGRPPRLVVSAGALDALSRVELAAVLAHERAHARERHHLALLPFAALRRLAPRWRMPETIFAAVALLLEMRADDTARRTQPAEALATALCRFDGQGALDRLTGRAGLPLTVRLLVLGTAATVAATPVSFFLPW